jgi:hypothetical protein
MRRFTLMTCLFLVFAAIWGCAATPPPPPPVAKVSGKVTLDGQPMATGKAFLTAPGQAPKEFDVKAGEFSGEAFTGKNHVQIVVEKDGPPATTDKKEPTKINAIAPHTLAADVTEGGANSFTFDVKTKK